MLTLKQETGRETAGIYIHIPFCKQACVYCNFHFSTSLKYKAEMVDAIVRELELQAGYLAGIPIGTLYLGGGTPSLLSAEEVNRIADTVQRCYNAESITECTLEANPDDLDKTYIKALGNTPVNRLSIGVQSFYDRDLLYMKRVHNAQEADYAIKAAQDSGLTNISIDLIYGTPGLTDNDWTGNLNKVKELGVQHFSAYALTVEERTALHHNIAKKKSAPVDPEQASGQFDILCEHAATMGYEHYEISNLALPGHHAVHNTNYWRGLPYLGIGPSAHSFDGARERRWNVANNQQYLENILKNNSIPCETERLTDVQVLNEYIMTSLRTMWGCDLGMIATKYGSDAVKTMLYEAEEHLEKGRAYVDNDKLILTQKGRLFADGIASDLFF